MPKRSVTSEDFKNFFWWKAGVWDFEIRVLISSRSSVLNSRRSSVVRILAGMMNNNLVDAKVKASAQTISKDESKLEKYFLFWGIGRNQLWLKLKLNPMEIRVHQNDIDITQKVF